MNWRQYKVIKLDYTLETPEERNELVKKINESIKRKHIPKIHEKNNIIENNNRNNCKKNSALTEAKRIYKNMQ